MSEKNQIIYNTFKGLDIFSVPYFFSVDKSNRKYKKTLFGGILSSLIIFLSLIYFIYLCYLYFDNKIQPSIASTVEFPSSKFPMQITKEFISVKITAPSGQTLYDFQKEKGKIYLSMMSTLFNNGIQNQFKPIPLIPCESEILNGYLCLDIKALSQGKDELFINFTPGNIEKESISIFFAICDQKFLSQGQVCEQESEIKSALVTYNTKISLRIQFQQYNTQKKSYEPRVKEESFYFDSNLAFYTKFNLQMTHLSVNQGFIIQSTEENQFFSDYYLKHITATQSFIITQLGFKIYGGLVFFIGQETINLQIQYAQFTNLLAQFTSVFNSLLFLGFFCKLLAQSEIVYSVIEQQLRYFYKQTAFQLVEKFGNQKEIENAKKEGSLGIYKYLQKINFHKDINEKLKLNFLKKIKMIIMQDSKKDKKMLNQSEEQFSEKIFNSLIGESNKALNIFEVQKEILQLKLILRLLLSVEQYAAIQLCGSRIPQAVVDPPEATPQINPQNQISETEKNILLSNEKQKDTELKEIEAQYSYKDKQNHLEKIELLEKDQNYFEKCVKNFLSHSNFQSNLDIRIRECMIGQEQQVISNSVTHIQPTLILDQLK